MADYRKDGNTGRKKKKASPVFIILLVICVGVFLFAAWNLYKIWSEYHEGEETYDRIAEIATLQSDTETEQEYPDIDLNAVLEMNKDTIGWIYFPNIEEINYPLVYSGDNWTYLASTFEGVFNGCGTLFVDMVNSPYFADCNTIIYGHNMYNDSMFGKLPDFADPQFGLSNPVFYLYTISGGVYRCHNFAFFQTTETSDAYTYQFATREEYQAFQQEMRSRSMYDFGVEPSPDQHMVTLSTCTNVEESDRYLLQAVIEEGLREEYPPLPALPWVTSGE